MSFARRLAIAHAFRRTALPLAWYYGITLALPLANGAAHSGASFVKHALVVLSVPPALIVLVCATREIVRALARASEIEPQSNRGGGMNARPQSPGPGWGPGGGTEISASL